MGILYSRRLVMRKERSIVLPDMEWAKFRCVGSMPGALQSVNTKIFKEWLPGNREYKIAMGE